MPTPPPSLLHGPTLEWAGPLTLSDALEATIRDHPTSTLTLFDHAGECATISHAELRTRARRRWADLTASGVRPGDVLLILADDVGELLEIAWACFVGGAIAAPVAAPLDFSNDEAGMKRLRDALAVLPNAKVVVPPSLAGRASSLHATVPAETELLRLGVLTETADAESIPARHDTTDALYLLTSGSTGLPKVVPLAHRQIVLRSVATQKAMPLDAGDIALNWMPLDHVGGIVMWHLSPLVTGCSQVQVPTAFVSAEPTRWLDLVDRFRASFIWAPNFAFSLVNERLRSSGGRAWDLSCVRAIVNGGEAINPATATQFLKLLAPYGMAASSMRPMWGMSETASGCVLAPALRDDLVPGRTSVGMPLPGVSLRLTDERGAIVPQGETGVLEVKGLYVTPRYQACDDAARMAFRDDGWFSTGDEGVVLDGELVLVGRSSETIIINGVNHHAQAIEAAVEALDWVRRGHVAACALAGPGHDTDGVVIFVGTADDGDLTAEQAQQVRTALLDGFGINPNAVVGLRADQFPRTGLGKIQRKALARSHAEGAFAVGERKESFTRSPLLVPVWVEQPFAVMADAVRCWTIEADVSSPEMRDLAARLQQRLATAAKTSSEVRGHILFLSELDRTDASELAAEIDADNRMLARLAADSGDCRLTIVALAEREAAPELAARIAYLQNAAVEYAQVTVRVVAVDRSGPEIDDALLAALDSDEAELRFTAGTMHARRYACANLGGSRGSPLVEGGHYLITGSGEVAQALARFFIDELRSTVTIVGRRPSEASSDDPHLWRAVADVSDVSALSKVVAEANAREPLSAVFHLANHVREWPMLRMGRQVLVDGLAPKVAGAQALLKVCDENELDVPIIAFSSLLSSFFSPLYGVYVAANRFLDATAQARFPRFRSLAWGSWSGLGISRDLIQTDKAHRVGFGTMPLAEAFAGLRLGLEADSPVVLIGANPAGTRIAPMLAAGDGAADGPHIRIVAPGNGESGRVAKDGSGSALSERETSIVEPIVRIWTDILGVAAVSLDDNFFALGGDSLAIAELHHQLCELAGADLPIVPLFRAHSLREMVRFVAAHDA